VSFWEQTGTLLSVEQGYDQEACSRMEGEGCPNCDDEDDEDDGLRARSEAVYGMGQETLTPARTVTAQRLGRIQ
jgi:hypothetical protein